GTKRTTELNMMTHRTSYRLSNGAYEGVNITVGNSGFDGAEGTFVQEDARVNLSSNLIVGAVDAHGHYSMKNGSLSADLEVVGDSGYKGMFALSKATFLQDGGTNTVRSLV